MSYSQFRKGFEQRSPVATAVQASGAAVTKSTYLLNKDYLTSEWILHVVSTQASTVAATAASVIDAIQSVTLEFMGSKRGGNGVRINLSGQELFDIMRITENVPSPITTFTATLAKVEWSIDIYAALAHAYNDYMTSVYTAEFSQIKLTVNWNDYTSAGVFSGGTLTGTSVTHTSDVSAINMPVPNTSPNSNSEFYAVAQQVAASQRKTPTAAGAGDDVLLQTGQKVRFILITSRVSGAFDDAVVDTLKMNFAGYNHEVTFAALKNENQADRGFSQTGRAILDFGDQPDGWLDLRDLNEARLKWTALKAGTVDFAQVSMRSLNS